MYFQHMEEKKRLRQRSLAAKLKGSKKTSLLYSLVIFEYYNVIISEHYSLRFSHIIILRNIIFFPPFNAHNSASRAAPELISKLIISEFDALSFDNNEHICVI